MYIYIYIYSPPGSRRLRQEKKKKHHWPPEKPVTKKKDFTLLRFVTCPWKQFSELSGLESPLLNPRLCRYTHIKSLKYTRNIKTLVPTGVWDLALMPLGGNPCWPSSNREPNKITLVRLRSNPVPARTKIGYSESQALLRKAVGK